MTLSRSPKRREPDIPLDQSRKFDDVLHLILDEERAPSERIPRVVAMIAPHTGSGTTFLCRSLASHMNRAAAQRDIARMATAATASPLRKGYVDRSTALTTIDDLLSQSAYLPDPSHLAITVDYREISRPGAHVARVLAESLDADVLQGVVQGGRTVQTLLNELPAEWDSRPRCRREYFQMLASSFRLVFVDMPSLEESIELRRVAPLVDGVIVGVEADRTTAQELDRLVDTIERSGGKVLGYLLNKRRYPVPDWLYKLLTKAGIS